MASEKDYININKRSWNARTAHHLTSKFYDVPGFLKGDSSLNAIEVDLLGDVSGKSILHLQCHFGQDTISLARLGATCTGVDFSDAAISAAEDLAKQTATDVDFICSDIYELPNHLEAKFDIIYTSYGVIGWLPDLDKWANVINHFLKPGGRLVFVEFHPLVWMFDDDFTHIKYSYFKANAIIESETGTYADKAANITNDYICWNHSLSSVITSLLDAGLYLKSLSEFDYSPYNCFNNTVETDNGTFRIKHLDDKIPIVYALQAVKAPK